MRVGESSHTIRIRPVSKFLRIVVYSPQIIENYQLKSGEGLSVFFVLIWLAGDLANLFGALLAGLLPTIIILAAYVRSFINLCLDVIPILCFPVFSLRYHLVDTDLLLPMGQSSTAYCVSAYPRGGGPRTNPFRGNPPHP